MARQPLKQWKLGLILKTTLVIKALLRAKILTMTNHRLKSMKSLLLLLSLDKYITADIKCRTIMSGRAVVKTPLSVRVKFYAVGPVEPWINN